MKIAVGVVLGGITKGAFNGVLLVGTALGVKPEAVFWL